MTTHDRDKIIAAAKEAGSSVVGGDDGTDTQCWTGDIAFDEEGLDLFYAIAFEDGRKAEREDCAKVCDERYKELMEPETREMAEAIRARGDRK